MIFPHPLRFDWLTKDVPIFLFLPFFCDKAFNKELKTLARGLPSPYSGPCKEARIGPDRQGKMPWFIQLLQATLLGRGTVSYFTGGPITPANLKP